MSMLDDLKKYFNETPREQVLKDWADTENNAPEGGPKLVEFLNLHDEAMKDKIRTKTILQQMQLDLLAANDTIKEVKRIIKPTMSDVEMIRYCEEGSGYLIECVEKCERAKMKSIPKGMVTILKNGVDHIKSLHDLVELKAISGRLVIDDFEIIAAALLQKQ